MIEKIKSITVDQNEFISKIQQVHPKSGDVFFFHIKTDDNGNPLADLETLHKVFVEIERGLAELGKNISTIFLLNCDLFSIKNKKEAKEVLEEYIFAAKKAMDQLGDIEN